MDWEGRKILVTGAGGFIGSHLTEALVEAGAKVRAFVHYNSRGDPGLLRQVPVERRRKVEIYFGELRDPGAVRQAMEGCQVVFHLGALIGIPYSYAHPTDVVQTNVLGTLNVVNAARALEVERVIHTSTSEVYGSARYVPIDEAHPLQGQSPYSASKIGADKLVESFHAAYGLPVCTVRPFNTYGPRQSARAVIPTIIVQLATRDRLTLGSLHPKRDFNYVGDTVSGFLAVAASEASLGEVINIGSGREISIGELVELLGELMGREVVYETDVKRVRPEASEVQRLLSDTSKAHRLLGWQPTVSLEEGLRRTVEWVLQHLEYYQAERYAV